MNINSLTNSITTNSSNSTSSTNNSEDPASQRDLFMTLLVAQLKNQDPLEPQDGTQFVAQLAQFNSLDQLVSIRQSMEQLVSAINTGQTSSASATLT